MNLSSSATRDAGDEYRPAIHSAGPEKRSQKRYPLAADPECELFVRIGENRYPVKAIRDLSESGISIFLDTPLADSTPVVILYIDDRMQVELKGSVAWCAPHTDGAGEEPVDAAYAMGLKLMSPTMLMVALQRNR